MFLYLTCRYWHHVNGERLPELSRFWVVQNRVATPRENELPYPLLVANTVKPLSSWNLTWDQALFSFRFENYIPSGKAKRKESLIQTFYERLPPAFLIDWHLPNQPTVACFSSMQIFHAWKKCRLADLKNSFYLVIKMHLVSGQQRAEGFNSAIHSLSVKQILRRYEQPYEFSEFPWHILRHIFLP